MSKRGWISISFAFCSLVVLTTASPSFAAPPDNRMATFETSTGETYFALSLSPSDTAPAAHRDIVILVDTSASQTGLFRDDSFTALRALLNKLSDSDRVQIMAVDVNA